MSESPETSHVPARHPYRLIVLEAILATLLGHALLLFLFVPAPPVPAGTPPRTAGIALFNLNNASPEGVARMENWMAIHDPSHIARSDTVASPTARLPQPLRNLPADRPRPEPGVSLPPHSPSPPDHVRASPAPGIPLYPEAVFALKIPQTAAQLPPQVLQDGRPISLDLPPEALELSRSIHATCTRLLLRRETRDGQIRFTILQTGGSAKLDLLAARLLIGDATRLKIETEPVEFQILWNPAAGEQL